MSNRRGGAHILYRIYGRNWTVMLLSLVAAAGLVWWLAWRHEWNTTIVLVICGLGLLSTKRRLLYVGRTCNPQVRFLSHSKKFWWKGAKYGTMTIYPNQKALVAAETRAIRHEHPKVNVIHNTKRRR